MKQCISLIVAFFLSSSLWASSGGPYFGYEFALSKSTKTQPEQDHLPLLVSAAGGFITGALLVKTLYSYWQTRNRLTPSEITSLNSKLDNAIRATLNGMGIEGSNCIARLHQRTNNEEANTTIALITVNEVELKVIRDKLVGLLTTHLPIVVSNEEPVTRIKSGVTQEITFAWSLRQP